MTEQDKPKSKPKMALISTKGETKPKDAKA